MTIPRFPLSVFFAVLIFSLSFRGASAAGAPVPAPPKGFYLLNDKQTSITKMKLPAFLSGFTLRVAWSDLEKSKGVYDFSQIGTTVTYLQEHNLKLTLEIFASMPPAYVVTGASSTFTNAYGKAPTPWDASAQARWKTLLTALAKYQVMDSSLRRKVSLSEHPVLTAVNAPVVGLQSIRDVTGALVKKSDYTRAKFIDAVSASVLSCRTAFPKDYLFLGFFRMADTNAETPLDQAVFSRLQQDFMGAGKPGLGLFQEVWSDVGPDPLGLGSFLLGLQGNNTVMLQALTSWKRPFIDPQKVSSQNPDGALDSAYVNFGCRYFEIYYPDATATDLQPVFTEWAAFLAAH